MTTVLLFLLVIITTFTIVLFCVKIYRQLVLPKIRCHTCMVRKIVIITGSNRGMGYCVALDFANRGARVILACRNKKKAEEARQKIINATDNSDVVVRHLNLASFRSIRTFAFKMLKTENRLDILVNNAGILKPNSITEDAYYTTLQVNALGPFLLVYLLLDLLKSTRNSRVINVTTLEGMQYETLLPNLIDSHDNIFSYIRNYNNSKKCLNLLMLEMAERLKYTNVSIYFSLPRLCSTDLYLYDSMPFLLKLIKKKLFYFFHLFPDESALNTIYCALSNDLPQKTGTFYRDCREYNVQVDQDVDVHQLRRNTWDRILEDLELIDDIN